MPGGDPFLAPTDNTVFKTYEYVILANSIVHTVIFALAVLKMAGVHWMNAIACLIGKLVNKIKNLKR